MFRLAPRVSIALACAIGVLAVASIAESASTLMTTGIGGPTGPLETSRHIIFARDVGISAQLGNRDYWLFGDTYIPASSYTNTPAIFIGGSTAAFSSKIVVGQAPVDLQEIRVGQLSPNLVPTRFLPQPRSAFVPGANGVACTGGGSNGRSIRWITGATAAPATLALNALFVTFETACVQPTTATVEGWGFALFDTSTNTWNNITDVMIPTRNGASLPERLRYGWPTFNADGTVTFFSHACTRGSVSFLCDHTTLFSASFPATLNNLSDKNRYAAVPIMNINGGMDAALFAMGRSTTNTSSTFYYLRQSDLGGNVDLYKATKAVGPYGTVGSTSLPGCSGLDTGMFCYALTPHSELSAPGTLFVTYYVPRGNGQAEHLAAAIIRLPATASSTTTTLRPR